jgi:hypothetical protein
MVPISHLIAKRAFSQALRVLYGVERIIRRSVFAELGHTSAQLALLVDRVGSPFIRRIAELPAV